MNKIIENMNFKEYLEDESMSQSALKNLAKSPQHYQYIKDHPHHTEAMKFGHAFHTFILEPDKFEDEYYDTPKIRKSGNAWKEVVSLAGGKEIIFEEDLKKIRDMKMQLQKNSFCAHLLNESTKEVSMFWENSETKIKCKGRLDGYYKDTNLIFDLKTTQDCINFKHSFFKFRYHIQAAFYLDAIQIVTGELPTAFIIFAIEKEPPYSWRTYIIYSDSEVIKTGRKEYKFLLEKYKLCKEKNSFDIGTEDDVDKIEFVPRWYDRLTTEEY